MSGSGAEPSMVVRSFRPVFRLERRLTRFDQWRIPWPGGVPLRGVGYFAGLAGVMWLLDRASGGLLSSGPLQLTLALLIGLPIAMAAACTRLRVDDRDAILAACALLAWALGAKRLVALRAAREPEQDTVEWEVPLVPDLRGSRYRRGRLSCACTVRLRQQARVARRGGRVELRPVEDQSLRPGLSVRVGPGEAVREVVFR